MTIYLIRHAQSQFNAVYEEGGDDPMIYDAPLSVLGEAQAARARENMRNLDVARVIVSPLTRALQTASILFGRAFPTQVLTDVREQVLNSCDIGRSSTELSSEFPHLDFDHITAPWWHNDEKIKDPRGISVEPEPLLQARADDFVVYLKENRIESTAIVSHGNFILAMSGVFPDNCGVVPFDLTGR